MRVTFATNQLEARYASPAVASADWGAGPSRIYVVAVMALQCASGLTDVRALSSFSLLADANREGWFTLRHWKAERGVHFTYEPPDSVRIEGTEDVE